MRGEHREIRAALAQLQAPPAGPGAEERVEKSLLDSMFAHEAMEELVFSPWIDETLTEIERLAIFEQMRKFPPPAPARMNHV